MVITVLHNQTGLNQLFQRVDRVLLDGELTVITVSNNDFFVIMLNYYIKEIGDIGNNSVYDK